MRRTITVCIAVVLLLGLMAPAHAGRVRTKRLAKGVTLRVIRQTQPKLRIRVASISPKVRHRIRTVLGSGKLPGLERTSSMARRKGAIVAINGDYARRSGRPVMTFARAGRLLQTPLVWGRNFALTRDAGRAYIGHPKVSVTLKRSDRNVRIARVNNGGPGRRTLALFSKQGGKLERPPRRGCSARLIPSGIPKRAASGGLTTRFSVGRVFCGKGRIFPMGGVVVSARGDGKRRKVITSLRRFSNVSLNWSLGWKGAYQTLGGNPTLVEGGRVVVGHNRHDPFFRRNPRSAVGIGRNGRIFFVTVDGRQRRSRGMTLRGLALFMRHRIGARWALNLDGGGSTTMVVRGRVINRPSDRRERPVSSALVLLRRGGARNFRAGGRVVRGPVVWDELVSDPASTGGLAASLGEKQAPLDRSLEKAARAFRESVR